MNCENAHTNLYLKYVHEMLSLYVSLSGIVLRHTGVDSEHVTGGFRARKNCERVSNICVLKSVISW